MYRSPLTVDEVCLLYIAIDNGWPGFFFEVTPSPVLSRKRNLRDCKGTLIIIITLSY